MLNDNGQLLIEQKHFPLVSTMTLYQLPVVIKVPHLSKKEKGKPPTATTISAGKIPGFKFPDCDRKFLSELRESVFKFLNIFLLDSATFDPQTDGSRYETD